MNSLQETLWHDERGVFRARTGGAFNFPWGDGEIRKGDGTGGSGQTFPSAGTVPIARILPGLLSTEGKDVRGDNDSDFRTIKVGDYLYNGGAGGSHEVRQIAWIDGKLMKLHQEFSVDISDSVVLVCGRQDLKKIVARNVDDTNDTILQEAEFSPLGRFDGGGAPISYDAGSGEIEFTVHR